jgi:hypothetical protein
VATAQPRRYYYDRAREVQNQADAYRLRHGSRPPSVTALFLDFLEDENLLDDEKAARAWADFYAHYDIEPSSSLILVRIEQDHPAAAQELVAAWRSRRRRGT